MKKLSLLFAALLAVSMSFATTVTKTVNQLVEENEWTVSSGNVIGTLATNFALDNVITVSTTGTPNCGSIWGTTTKDWRLYQNQNGNVTITAAEGYTLSTVKLTFTVAKTGVLLDAAGNTVASNSEIEVTAQNVTFTVGNSSTATNGQVKLTAFEVTYLAVGDSTIIPVDTTIVPVDTTIVPVDTTVVPVDTTIVPVDTTTIVYNTCAEVNAVTDNTDMVLGEVTVVFNKGMYVYVQDMTGTTLVYTPNYSDLVPGDRVSGIAGQAKLYNGLPELAATTAFADLTVTSGEAPIIFDAQAVPTAANINEVMMFRGVQMPTASFTTSRATNITGTFMGEEVAFRNNWKDAFDFVEGNTYNMLGCVAIYNGNIQVYATDFELIIPEDTTVVPVDTTIVPVDTTTIVYNTCADVNAVTANTDMVLGEVTVVFNKGMYVYVQDMTGTTLVYTNNYSDLVPGDRVSGIAGQAKLYNGLPELAPTTAFADLTVVAGEAPEIADAVAAPTAAEVNAVMMFRGVQMPTASFAEGRASNITGTFAGEEVAFRNCWKEAFDFDSTKTYTMLGCVAIYNGTVQVYVTNIEEEIAPGLHYYIKNNWHGAFDWSWMTMTAADDEGSEWYYTGIFGGYGVNINTAAADEGALWFPLEDFIIPDGGLVPQALDTVSFTYNVANASISAVVIGRPAPFTYNTCAEVNAITENTDMTLGEVTVVFAKGSNIYVQDATATTLVYSNQYSALKPGDHVMGIAGQATLYYGLPELKPNTAFEDLTVREGIAPHIPSAFGAPTEADINKVMMFRNVIMPDSATFTSDRASNITGIFYGDSVIFRNNWKDAYTFDGNKTYNMLGCVSIYNGTIQVYVTDIQEYAPATYYIKNNWNGSVVWEWAQMTQNELFDYQYEYTGVFGGTGVNISTAMVDFAEFWFSVSDFDIDPDGLVPQAGDTVYFNFNTVDETLYAHVVGRPTDVPVQYYIKNNWNGGEWTWQEMTPADDGNVTWTYTGIFGGTGVNINTLPDDAGAQWFPVNEWILTTLGYEPAAGDEILFEYNRNSYSLTATYMGGDGLETIIFQREGEAVKVLMNGQLYIIRDGKMYNTNGAQVR